MLPLLLLTVFGLLTGAVFVFAFKRDQNKALFDSLDELAEEAKKNRFHG